MFFVKRKTKYFVLNFLLGTTIWVWFVVFGQTSGNILKVAFFDIGQGDAIFIETHLTPAKALSDQDSMIPFSRLRSLWRVLKRIDELVREG